MTTASVWPTERYAFFQPALEFLEDLAAQSASSKHGRDSYVSTLLLGDRI